MKEKKRNLVEVAVLLVFLISLICIVFYFESSITSLTVYEEQEETQIWDFSTPADYTYNDSLIETSNGIVNLVSTTITTYWNTTTETEYLLQSALYNPSDKTSKVNQLDNTKHEVKNDKIFDMVFSENLDNNDIISLYIKDGNEGDIYLCDKGTLCNSPGYGLIYYDDEEGWYNITISGISTATSILNLRVSEKAKIDYIVSTQGEITKALYNPSDKTSKVNQLDNTKFEINKNKIFNLIFDNQINNNDVISLYLKSGNADEIYLCTYGESCSSPGYGSVNYDGEEGWYNITVSGLDQPKDAFNLDPEKVKIDFIKAINIEIEKHSSTNTTYPSSAGIETNDFTPANIFQWGTFSSIEQLNGQDTQYQYSIDSGEIWENIPENNDLSLVNSNTIRIKAILNSDTTGTPILNRMNLSYTTQICNENWNCLDWIPEVCPENETQTRICTDSNECGTEENKPTETQSCTYIPPCIEDWNVSFGECLVNDTQLKYYVDQNECGTMEDFPVDNGTYVICDYCALNDCSGSFQDSVSLNENETIEIDAINKTNAKLEINSSGNENVTFTIVGYNWTSKDIPVNITSVNKYLEIESDISGVNSMKITLYYTDEEILNVDEETLKINYYNETSGEWEELESIMNTTGNYIYVIISHLSLYGLFGEETEVEEDNGGDEEGTGEETSQSSIPSISRKYGRSAKRKITTIVTEETEGTETSENDNLEESLSLEENCEYELEISLPKIIPLFKQDFYVGEIINEGNCDIQKLNIYPDPELNSFASFSPSTIENLNSGDKSTFEIIRKDEKKGWFSYLTGSAVAENIMVKKIEGTIIIEGREENEVLFAKGSFLNMEVISSEKLNTVKTVSLVTIEVFAVLVIFLLLFRRFKKKK